MATLNGNSVNVNGHGINGHAVNGQNSRQHNDLCKDDKIKIFIGNIVHCQDKENLEVFENGFLVVIDKKIAAIGDQQSLEATLENLKINQKSAGIANTVLKNSQILIPGLIDTHIHAAQYPNAGLGYDKTLLDWLDSYTFKLERQYKDLKFAKKVYDSVVRKTLEHGTTTACYYGSLFVDSNLHLVDSCIAQGQRALVGKVNMTKCSQDDYMESPEENIKNTVKFIEEVLLKNCDLVKPIVTPRFALSLDLSDMKDLGQIANKYGLHVQTHISENKDEVRITKDIYKCSTYADVYDISSLLTPKTVLAHGIYLEEEELKLINKKGASVSHCPDSNTCLKSGLCDVRRLWRFGVKVGLGTDVSGGPLPSIVRAMKSALDVSIHLSFQKENYTPLTYKDVFYLATLGGAEALAMDEKVGSFHIGKEFDALLVDANPEDGGNIDYLIPCEPLELLQKFVYCGDNRNIDKVYVAGKCVKYS